MGWDKVAVSGRSLGEPQVYLTVQRPHTGHRKRQEPSITTLNSEVTMAKLKARLPQPDFSDNPTLEMAVSQRGVQTVSAYLGCQLKIQVELKAARLQIITGQAGRVALHPEFITPKVVTLSLEKATEMSRRH